MHVYTLENLFHFLHQLSAIIWLGGVIAINVLQLMVSREREPAAIGPLLHRTDLYGRAVIAPAAIFTLITGLVLIAQMDDVAWDDLWVLWGVGGMVVSVLLGATLIRATNADLRRLAASPGGLDPQWEARQRRIATLYGINVLLLLSILWVMIFKPTL